MRYSSPATFRAALAAALSAGALACASAARAADVSAEELSAGWRYERICPPGKRVRFRLKLDVALDVSHEAGGGAADAAEGDPSAEGEFRVLLDRVDERNFVCLRCAPAGGSHRIELLKYVDGRRAALHGRTSRVVEELARAPEEARPVDGSKAGGGQEGGEPAAGELEAEHGAPGRTIYIDRAPGLWAVSLDRAEVITAIDTIEAIDAGSGTGPPSREGDVAWGASGRWKLVGRKLQKMEPVYFEDGFTRRHFNEHGDYDVLYGRWWLDSVRDPGRTVNAFRLRGAGLSPGRQAVIVTGHDFWRGYRIEASIRFLGEGAAGLVFGVRDRKTLGLLRWRRPAGGADVSARGARDGAKNGAKADAGGRLEIVHIRPRRARSGGAAGEDAATAGAEGEEKEAPRSKIEQRTLLALPWSPRRDQWYRVSISLGSDAGEVEVNGRSAAFELPEELRCGLSGLYVNSDDGVLFDDIRVRSHEGVIARARDSIWSWAGLGRTNDALAALGAGPLRVRTSFEPGSGPLSITWPDRAGATVEVLLDPASSKGSVARRLLPAPFPPVERIAEFPLGNPEGAAYSAELTGDGVAVLRGRAVVADARLAAARAGPVRLSSPGAPVKLSGLAATPLEQVPPLKRKRGGIPDAVVKQGQEQHTHKWDTFLRWIHDRGSWEREKEGAVLRCRTPFWGPLDVEFETKLPEKVGDTAGLRLVPGRGAPAGVVIRRDESGCAVYSHGETAGKALGRYWPGEGGEGGEGRVRLALARAGRSVEGRIGGELFLRAELPPGAPVRIEAQGTPQAKPEPDDVEIRAQQVDESLFESAPTEWARWRGHWDVTPKWDCDQRWTFLGLWSDRIDTKREAAGAFSRGSYFGDLDLHVYFAFKDVLGRRKQGRRYVRRDLNFAFACEPGDLASGYCLLVGGLDNRGVQLARRGKLVAESDGFRFPPTGTAIDAIHWLWYEIRILREGDTIRVVHDGKELITWTDPEPLAGGHVAAWVLGGGMIVARTRFSAERRGDDDPAFDEGASPGGSLLGWRAAEGDRPVLLTEPEPGVVRVTNLAGGGHVAASYAPAREASGSSVPKAAEARDPGKGQPAALAFRASEGCVVALHLRSGGGDAPPGGDDAQALPADGRWHVVPLAKPLGEGERLVIGNYAPGGEGKGTVGGVVAGYSAAGIGANARGAWYEVRLFASKEKAEAFVKVGRE